MSYYLQIVCKYYYIKILIGDVKNSVPTHVGMVIDHPQITGNDTKQCHS